MDDFKPCLAHSGIVKSLESLCIKIEEKQIHADLKIQSILDSVQVAKHEMDRRLEGMNEFRSQLASQASTFANRREMELIIEKFEARIKPLEELRFISQGSHKASEYIVTVIIAAIVAAVSKLIF